MRTSPQRHPPVKRSIPTYPINPAGQVGPKFPAAAITRGRKENGGENAPVRFAGARALGVAAAVPDLIVVAGAGGDAACTQSCGMEIEDCGASVLIDLARRAGALRIG